MPAPRPWLRPLAVFAATFAVLAAIAGGSLLRPSPHNHYSHLAAAWLDGRLDHQGTPPGYPRRHNDWGRVTTLSLRDGGELRGFPCATSACDARRRQERGIELWWSGDGELVALPRRAILRRADTWYVTFPPGPALLFLPGVAWAGLGFADRLLTALLAALIPAILVAFLDRRRGLAEGRGREHLGLAAAWALASPALFVGAHGSVWFTAQITGALALMLAVIAAWEVRRPALAAVAGLCFGFAIACRPTIAFALPFFVGEWWRGGRDLRRALAFAAPLAVIAGLLLAHNWVRFGDPLEFGHRYLDVRWQRRIQELGMFSTAYLRRNLECMLWLAPQVSASAPSLRWSIHGMGLLFAAPWLGLLAASRRPFPQRWGLVAAAIAVALPPLFYHNSGQLQLSYRFILDALPLLVLLIAFGGGARHRKLLVALVILGALPQLYGAWHFEREPAAIFVPDLWWPFAPES